MWLVSGCGTSAWEEDYTGSWSADAETVFLQDEMLTESASFSCSEYPQMSLLPDASRARRTSRRPPRSAAK